MADADAKLSALETTVATLTDKLTRAETTLARLDAFARGIETLTNDPAISKLFGSRPQDVYTQTYAASTYTMPAYTADNESAAYTATPAALSDAATLVDVNALRTAVENLRPFVESIAGVTNQQTNTLAAMGLAQKA